MNAVIIRFKKGLTAQERIDAVKAANGQVTRTYILPAVEHIVLANMHSEDRRALRVHAKIASIDVDDDPVTVDVVSLPNILAEEYDANWGIAHTHVPAVHLKGIKGQNVKVAVLDTGRASTNGVDHSDLRIAGSYNAITPGQPDDDGHGHSHHVSGIVAAQINSMGVVGVAPDVELYNVKVLSDSGSGSWSSVINGIVWCMENGIDVTSNSYGASSHPGQAVEDVFAAAADAGMIHICSAGNNGAGANTVGYPARLPSCQAIVAIDINNNRASFSSTGPDAVCTGPGVNVFSTYKGNGYTTMSGTSMSCPFVTGMVALALSAGVTDPLVKIAESSIDLGVPGRDDLYGHGLLMADRIVGEPDTPVFPRKIKADGSQSTDPDGEVMTWIWQWGDGETSRSVNPTFNHTYAVDGTYTIIETVLDDKDLESEPVEVTIMVRNSDPANEAPTAHLVITAALDSVIAG